MSGDHTTSSPPLAPSNRWCNLGDLIDRTGDLSGTALIDLFHTPPRSLSHLETDRLINGVARFLTAGGLKRGDRVAILSANRAETLICYFGIMRAGFVAVPINVKLPRETMEAVVADSQAAFAFTDRASRPAIEGRLPFLDFDDDGETGFHATIEPCDFEAVPMGQGEIAQILYTSGSSGLPKGVPLSHSGQLWSLYMRTCNGIRRDDQRYLIAQPLFHMNGLFSSKIAFATTASIVLMPAFEVHAYVDAIATYGITILSSIPTMFARILKEADYVRSRDTSSLKRIMMGSAPITATLFASVQALFPHAMLTLTFGATEMGPAIFGPHPDGLPIPPVSLGYPVNGTQVRLMDGPSPDEGVLWVRNPAVMPGYHNRPDLSDKVLRDGWYITGDVLRRDENNFYYFVGRADDMFVCSGENIYPAEVERLLERHPGVQQAVVVPLPDEERGQMPVAFLVPKRGAELTAAGIKEFTIANGPAYQHPRRMAFVSDLPWAGTNKIDRAALKAEALRREAERRWET